MNKIHSPNEPDSGDKSLWELMGRTRNTKAGPMFSRNVVREVRLLDSKSGMASWLEILKRPAVLVGAAAVVLVLGISPLFFTDDAASLAVIPETADPVIPGNEVDQFDPTEEMDTIETLGQLMAVSDPGTLSDEALLALLF